LLTEIETSSPTSHRDKAMGYLTNMLQKLRHASRNRRTGATARKRYENRLRFERLEDRMVLSASFGSAIALESAGISNAMDVATDPAGNAIISGLFSGTVDFDPAATHMGDADILTAGSVVGDIFFAKYATDGSLLWANQMVGEAGSGGAARSVTTDASGNVYLAGDFIGTVSFGGNILTSVDGAKDGFVAKIGSDGTVLWAQRWGGVGTEYVNGIAVDNAGNVFTAGTTSMDGSMVYTNLQIEKFSASGTLVWARQIGNSSGWNTGSGIDADTAGNIYVSGSFTGTVDFDPGSGTRNVTGGTNNSGFVLKLTAAGNYGWVSTFVNQSSTANSSCSDLVVDGSNNIVVGGSYRGAVDFKPGNGTRTLPYVTYSGGAFGGGFLAKLNSAGSLIWAQQAGIGWAAVRSVSLDTAGNVYAAGLFQGADSGITMPLDFDPGAGTNILTCKGKTDIFVAKYTAAGTYQWAVALGGTGTDMATGIAVDVDGNVYVAGYFYNTVDFDPDPLTSYELTSAGGGNGFFLKLRQI
jgi:Beta-propeller repeat